VDHNVLRQECSCAFKNEYSDISKFYGMVAASKKIFLTIWYDDVYSH